jgi:hypothetical protein
MPSIRPVAGAFNQGETPRIAVFNKAKTALGVDLDTLISAMQKYVDRCVAPVWGAPAKLVSSSGFIRNHWAMVFLDVADAPGALAYHDLTPDGLPMAKVFVKTTLQDHALVSVSASHELVEMLVDPAINLLTTGPQSETVYAYESADPVEELSFKVDGIPMSDFVYPSYFEDFHRPGSVPFDHMRKVKKPFQILAGGYQSIFRNGKWGEIYGSAATRKRLQREDRRGHRSEQRRRRTLKRSSSKAVNSKNR